MPTFAGMTPKLKLVEVELLLSLLLRRAGRGGQLDAGLFRRSRGFCRCFLLAGNAGEALVELGQLAAAINHAMHAGPCRMRLGIDVEMQLRARLAVGRAGDEFGAVGHNDGDFVIIGMSFVLHGLYFQIYKCGAAPFEALF